MRSSKLGWRWTRGRYLMRETDRRSATGTEELLSLSKERGVLPRGDLGFDSEGRADSLIGYKSIEPGVIVMNKMQAWNGMFGLAGRSGIVSPEYTTLLPQATADARFLVYMLKADFYVGQFSWRSRGMGSAFLRLHPENLLDTPFLVPTPAVQQAIADFLDRETARIDALITAKRRMIEVLEERWAVAVRERVLGDGDGSAFPVVHLKRLWTVIDCKHRTPAYTEEGFPVVSPGDVTPGHLDLTRCTRFVGRPDFEDLTSEGRRPKVGDIIYSRNASIGIAAFVADDLPFTMGQDVCLITSKLQDQRFLAYVLNTIGLDQLEEAKIGSTFSRVNVRQIKELLVPGCSPQQQRAIADALDREHEDVERCLRLLTSQIGLLVEHRQALITAAVTGELDVEVAA